MKALRILLCVLVLCGVAQAQMGANLVPPSTADCVAVQSGSWQDAATWDGNLPQQGQRVFIPPGRTVELDGDTADVLWIHCAGTLTCCEACDSQLNVHTLYVPMGGSFRLGVPGMPATGRKAVEFLPGPFLPGDQSKLSRGAIVHGEFVACGREKTAFATVTDSDLPVGATELSVSGVPYGWRVGDELLIAGTDSPRNGDRYQSEYVTVTDVDGEHVTFTPPLQYRHFRWRDDLPYHVANLTRNVVFRSRDPETIENRGHLMFMSPACHLFYTERVGLGRTDKSQPVTDPRFDLYGELIAGSDANPRARYSSHWHRVGPLGPPAYCIGGVTRGSPGWGVVNHASNVIVEDEVCIDCFGSGFVTEEGQERGYMQRCLAAMNHGEGDTITSTDADHGRRTIGDWGTDGSGFWLQGGLVEVSDCVAFDNSGRGFALFNAALNSYPNYGQGDSAVAEWIRYQIVHDASLLPESYRQTPWWLYANPSAISSSYVPQRVFARNTAYNNKVGLQSWFVPSSINISSRLALPPDVRGSITDLTLWGRGASLHAEYTRQFTIDGLKVIGEGIFRKIGSDGSIDQRAAGLILRFPDMAVRRYESSGIKRRLEDITGDPTHVVEE
jgi:hypothetical protein